MQTILSDKMPVHEDNDLFVLSQKADLIVESPVLSQKRFFAFPFWHEEFLVYANENNTTMNHLQSNLIELDCHALY